MSDEQDPGATDRAEHTSILEMISTSPLMQRLREQCNGEELESALAVVNGTAEYYDGLIRMIRENVKTKEDVEAFLQSLESSK